MQIIRINQETHRISLGMKQLESDPWEGIGGKYPIGKKIRGTVTNTPTTTARSWNWSPASRVSSTSPRCPGTKKTSTPGKILSTTQQVDVVVLEVDPQKRRISLGLKQTLEIRGRLSPATTRSLDRGGEVKNKTEFGLFIGLDGDVDRMVHLSYLDWSRPASM